MVFKRSIAATVVVVSVLLPLTGSAQVSLTQDTAKASQQAELEQQLKDIEAQIAGVQSQLTDVKGQKSTLQSAIARLKREQSVLELQMQAMSLRMSDLDDQYTRTLKAMASNELRIRHLKEQMSEHIRLLHEQEGDSLLVSILAEGKLSAAVDQIAYHNEISDSLYALLEQTHDANTELEGQRQALKERQDEITNLANLNTTAQDQLDGSIGEQNQLLTQTKGKESEYQALLADTRKRAAEIRGRIYSLQGVKNQPTFGEAVELAKQAGDLSGVRPAFLLAILTQESNLGKNVGTCNRPGDAPEKSWKVIMKPDRDQQPFLTITQELGLDPEITPVSCPMRGKDGKQIGWGGAMGPAQFIPSTWMGYKNKVSALTGKMANPWDIRDAFIAAGIKLAAGGATTQSGEWAAAMRYFSGGTNPQYRFYGDNVVATANRYQLDIDALQ
jgi:peptidoglycan hydrolase CwlO-like protein